LTLIIQAYQRYGNKTNELVDEFQFCCWENLHQWLHQFKTLHQCPACEAEKIYNEKKCPYCNSSDTVKFGTRKTKNGIKQRIRCNQCKKRFIEGKSYDKNKRINLLIMDLYFEGVTIRGIKDHLKEFYNISLCHTTILRRIQKLKLGGRK
jgi:transposase-like protein